MNDNELIMNGIFEILRKITDVGGEAPKCSMPIGSYFADYSIVDHLYFLLEISRKFNIKLSNNILENYTNWNLLELSDAISHCELFCPM